MSQIEITVRSCTLLKSQQLFTKMKNYVIVKANNGIGQVSEFKTKNVPGQKLKPIEWNESFTFSVRPGNNAIIEFIVMDKDMAFDDLCGKGFFKLDTCGVFNSGRDQDYNIRLTEEKVDVEAGNLYITTRCRN